MTVDHVMSSGKPLATIPRDQMAQYIEAGRAEEWTHAIQVVPVAALLDSVWEQHADRPWELRAGHWMDSGMLT